MYFVADGSLRAHYPDAAANYKRRLTWGLLWCMGAAAVAGNVACGEPFVVAGETGGGGGGDGGGGGQMWVCNAGQLKEGGDEPTLHTTFNNLAATESPLLPTGNKIGMVHGGTFMNGGLLLVEARDSVEYSNAADYLSASQGTVDFCFQPVASKLMTRREFVTVADNDNDWLTIRITKMGVLEVRVGEAGVKIGEAQFATDRWYRLTVVWSHDGGTPITVFVNEKQQVVTDEWNSKSSDDSIGIDVPLYIGDSHDNGNNKSPKAILDELYVFDQARTPGP